jgi:SAM-dependent methyltransferase
MLFSRRSKIQTSVPVQTLENNEFLAAEHLIDGERYLENYNCHIVSLIFQNMSNFDRIKVLEFGAGLGTLADIVRKKYKLSPTCVEIDKSFLKILSERGFKSFQSLPDLAGEKFDFIYSSNVLEHIDDDLSALHSLNNQLEPEGKLVLYVPALKFLYSSHDRSIGHYRRYSRTEIKEKLKKAGFEIDSISYNDVLGVIAWFILRFKRKNVTNSTIQNNSLRIYDDFVFPISRALDSIGFKRLFGKNLLIVATKSPSE